MSQYFPTSRNTEIQGSRPSPFFPRLQEMLNLRFDPQTQPEMYRYLENISEEEWETIPPGVQLELAEIGQSHMTGEAPGFIDRAAASFATSQTGKANILQGRGVDAYVKDGELGYRTPRGTQPVNPEGFDIGDVADQAGELPPILGSVAGATAAGPAGAPMIGAGLGAAAGDQSRQYIARQLGSGEELDPLRSGVEAGLGMGGEKVAGYIGNLVTGKYRKGATGGLVDETTEALRRLDQKLGTDLTSTAPIDMRVHDDALGQLTQRMREGQFSAQGMREGQDEPFQREVQGGLEAIGKTLTGQRGTPVRDLTGRSDPRLLSGEEMAGTGARDAAEKALVGRRQFEGDLHREFEAGLDPSYEPDLSGTMDALEDIIQREVVSRDDVAGAGVKELNDAIGDALAIDSFQGLDNLRRRVADMVKVYDPTKAAGGVQAAWKRLQAGLMKDLDNALVTQGQGDAGREAKAATQAVYQMSDSPTMSRLAPEQLSELPAKISGMTVEQVRMLKSIVGQEGKGPLGPTQQGTTAWRDLLVEIFDDLKNESMMAPSIAGGDMVVSGPKLQGLLAKFKPGALEEIMGPEVAGDLTEFAQMLVRAQAATNKWGNVSKTAIAQADISKDIYKFWSNPKTAAAEMISKIFTQKMLGRLVSTQTGKQFLTGQLPFQRRAGGPLRAMTRAAGQSTVLPQVNRFGTTQQDATRTQP